MQRSLRLPITRTSPRCSSAWVALALLASVAGSVTLAGCGDDGVPAELMGEAERIAGLDGPRGWEQVVPDGLEDGQFLRTVDGTGLIFAGDTAADGAVTALSAGTAWRSPVLDDAGAVAAACASVPAFAASSGFSGAVTATDLSECRVLPEDPTLRVGFVASFADAVVPQGSGNRSFGAGVLLDDNGGITVVVTVAFGLDR
jgi:hypothetical protein